MTTPDLWIGTTYCFGVFQPIQVKMLSEIHGMIKSSTYFTFIIFVHGLVA